MLSSALECWYIYIIFIGHRFVVTSFDFIMQPREKCAPEEKQFFLIIIINKSVIHFHFHFLLAVWYVWLLSSHTFYFVLFCMTLALYIDTWLKLKLNRLMAVRERNESQYANIHRFICSQTDWMWTFCEKPNENFNPASAIFSQFYLRVRPLKARLP